MIIYLVLNLLGTLCCLTLKPIEQSPILLLNTSAEGLTQTEAAEQELKIRTSRVQSLCCARISFQYCAFGQFGCGQGHFPQGNQVFRGVDTVLEKVLTKCLLNGETENPEMLNELDHHSHMFLKRFDLKEEYSTKNLADPLHY